MGPSALAQVLRPLASLFPPEAHPELLRGLEAPDDAAVWRLDDRRALVASVDFFPPVVDDPVAFGAIAAANSLSDLYAMGAEPLFGLNLVGFPDDLDPAILAHILRGGAEKMREAGAVVAGGHTTTDDEPKYGLAVVGLAHPDRLLTKAGARPGDVLLLTKPLGTGVLTTAGRDAEPGDVALDDAERSMARLNRDAARLFHGAAGAVHACTDVTGFGLVGHAHELARASQCGIEIRLPDLPWLDGAEAHARAGSFPGGVRRNRECYEPFVGFSGAVDGWQRDLLYDPQTSGGLLAAVDAERARGVLAEFERAGEPVWRIGEVTDADPGSIRVGSR